MCSKPGGCLLHSCKLRGEQGTMSVRVHMHVLMSTCSVACPSQRAVFLHSPVTNLGLPVLPECMAAATNLSDQQLISCSCCYVTVAIQHLHCRLTRCLKLL